MSACTKTEYVPDPNSTPNRTIYVDIPVGNWTPNATKTVWAATADIEEIDDWIMDSGTVLADISFNDGATFEPLSSTYNQQGYRFEYGLGYFVVDVQSTKADIAIDPPAKALIKLVLIDSEFVD